MRFFTIFDDANNEHLHKDVVCIPKYLQKYFGYKATLLSFSSKETSFLRDCEDISFLHKSNRSLFLKEISIIWFILRNARKIDILNLYHVSKFTALRAVIYRLFNSKGICYVKLDLDEELLDRYKSIFLKEKAIAKFTWAILGSIFKKSVSVFSCESVSARDKIVTYERFAPGKILVVRNGADSLDLIEARGVLPRENIICQSGRLGVEVKNTELFLKVIPVIFGTSWRAILMGDVDSRFTQTMEGFFLKFPEANKYVSFVGRVNSRDDYYDTLLRSKIFSHTSKAEGTPLVFGEAAACGTAIISTDVSGTELIRTGIFKGRIVTQDSEGAYRDALLELMAECELESEPYERDALLVARRETSWYEILKPLDTKFCLQEDLQKIKAI